MIYIYESNDFVIKNKGNCFLFCLSVIRFSTSIRSLKEELTVSVIKCYKCYKEE